MPITFKTDFELMKIPIRERGEPLVNLREYARDIIIEIEPVSKKFQRLREGTCFVRESVAIKLAQAQSLLPRGYRLKIVDGYRSLAAQKRIYSDVLQEMQKKFPRLSLRALQWETDKWVANPKTIPPHTTGGAVDVTLVDSEGKELDFGCPLNTSLEKAHMYYPELSARAKKSRQLLISIMQKSGFKNYPLEWWHWSYGDRIWAHCAQQSYALYGAVRKHKA